MYFTPGNFRKTWTSCSLGTGLINVREWSSRAAKKEYAVVFPDYFYGQINEARHQPGTFSLPARVAWDLLEATCDEIARKIVYTPIWWYAAFPNHYAGDGSMATRELGELQTEYTISGFVKALKADAKTRQLQKEYYDRVHGV
jgi:creatinine amidohydrolase/Fe(II)-dependent formamide hydrolase-like protein